MSEFKETVLLCILIFIACTRKAKRCNSLFNISAWKLSLGDNEGTEQVLLQQLSFFNNKSNFLLVDQISSHLIIMQSHSLT